MNDVFNSRFAGPKSPTNMQLGYFMLRIMLGVNLFFHGFMRVLTGVGAWADPMAATFADTYLPMSLVIPFLYSIPYIEILLGTVTLLGLFTRWALLGGVIFYVVLMYGQASRQSWSGVHTIMHYGIYYWILLVLQNQNWLALDNRRARA